MSSCFKPWGNIDWMLGKMPHIPQWGYLGCVSPEDRSTITLEWLAAHDLLGACEMWKIDDEPRFFSPYEKRNREKYDQQIEKCASLGKAAEINLPEFKLFDSDRVASDRFNSFVKRTDGNIMFDISSMPKRWFFPIVRECLQNKGIRNLVITYTVAKTYSSIQGEDPIGWRHIPSFGETAECTEKEKYYIISAGFQPLSLPDWIEGFPDAELYIIFPFPSDVNGYHRVWDFIRAIETDGGKIDSRYIEYVSGHNLPLIYNSVSKLIAREKDKQPVFVPYGPKPISLAFSLLASQLQIPVGYTQPTYYNPDYSIGVDMCFNGEPRIITYLIKQDGKILYTFSAMN